MITEARKTEFILTILLDKRKSGELMREYKGEPAETFLDRVGAITKGTTPDDCYVPPPKKSDGIDSFFRDYFLYKEQLFMQEQGV